jgi:hypothetical protein
MSEKLYTLYEAAALVGVPKGALVIAVANRQVEVEISYAMGNSKSGFNRKNPVYMITKKNALKFKEAYEEKLPYPDLAVRHEDKDTRKNKKPEDNERARVRKRLEMLRELKDLGLTPADVEL